MKDEVTVQGTAEKETVPGPIVPAPETKPEAKDSKPKEPAKGKTPKVQKTKPANNAKKTAPRGKGTVKKAKPAKAPKGKQGKALKVKSKKLIKVGKFPRHEKNPFREGSAYGAIFDAMATKKNGIRRDELLKLAAKATGKDVKHAAYDLAVILSAKDSPTGDRHPSCREGYWISRENEHLTLKLR